MYITNQSSASNSPHQLQIHIVRSHRWMDGWTETNRRYRDGTQMIVYREGVELCLPTAETSVKKQKVTRITAVVDERQLLLILG